MTQLDRLVEAGNTIIVVEHEMRVVAGSDWVIDMGPGAGEEGGRVVAAGPPADVAKGRASRTASYLARFLASSPLEPDRALFPPVAGCLKAASQKHSDRTRIRYRRIGNHLRYAIVGEGPIDESYNDLGGIAHALPLWKHGVADLDHTIPVRRADVSSDPYQNARLESVTVPQGIPPIPTFHFFAALFETGAEELHCVPVILAWWPLR